MKVHYLEIVTRDVDSVCASYESIDQIKFGSVDPGLGNARTASRPDGSMIGVRSPMADSEEPIVRPYYLVANIDQAVENVVKAGGEIAHPPLEIPGHGIFAIYILGGNNHGLWQLVVSSPVKSCA